MHLDMGRDEVSGDDRLFYPEDNIVTRAAFIIPEIMIETELDDFTGTQQLNRFIGPADLHPAFGSPPFVIEINFHHPNQNLSGTRYSATEGRIHPRRPVPGSSCCSILLQLRQRQQ